MEELETTIAEAVVEYAEKEAAENPNPERMDLLIASAVLTGISLTARFLAAHEGHSFVTPQAVERACQNVALRAGFEKGSIE